MNLILFERHELDRPLPAGDPRARHIRTVLRRRAGDTFDCGVIEGERGRGTVLRDDPAGLLLAFSWGAPPPPLDPLTLLIGLPRPQTARKILGEATALGAARLWFFGAARGEPSYAQSSLWSSGEVRRHLIAGAEQAFCTRLPETTLFGSLEEALAALGSPATRLALDNYEAGASLAQVALAGLPAALALGAERGWSGAERARLREAGFTLAHLGPRVLRTETACVAGLALLRARLGLL